MRLGIDLGINQRFGTATGTNTGQPAPGAFDFEVSSLTQSGKAISARPRDLRFSIDGNVTYCLPGFGNCSALTIAVEPDGKSFRVSGFANAAQRDALLTHHRQMPFWAVEPGNFDQLFARNPELPAPRIATAGPRPAGLGIRTTKPSAPIGVTA